MPKNPKKSKQEGRSGRMLSKAWVLSIHMSWCYPAHSPRLCNSKLRSVTHVTVNARATSGAHSKSAQKLSHSLLLPLAQRPLPAEVGTATSMMLMVRHNARGSRGPRRATGESTFGEDLPLSRAQSIWSQVPRWTLASWRVWWDVCSPWKLLKIRLQTFFWMWLEFVGVWVWVSKVGHCI